MGLPAELFTAQPINDEFLCPICHGVLQDPKIVHPCEHGFCNACITQWAGHDFDFGLHDGSRTPPWDGGRTPTTCPVDRQEIGTLKQPQRLFLNLLGQLELRCPYSGAGCNVVLKLGDLKDHDEECTHNPKNHTECEGDCGAVLTQAAAMVHMCVKYLKERMEASEMEWRAKFEAKEAELGRCQRRLLELSSNRAKMLLDSCLERKRKLI